MAKISRLLTVLMVTTFGALGFADEWRPTTVVNPYGPTVVNPYASTVGRPWVRAFPSGFSGVAAAPDAGAQPMLSGPQQPAVVPPSCKPDCWEGLDWWHDDYSYPPWCGPCSAAWNAVCRFSETGGWYVTAGTLWLTRSNGTRSNLSTKVSTGRSVMNTDDLDFDPQAGPYVTVGHYIGSATSLEWSFFGFYDWDARTSTGRSNNNFNPYWGSHSQRPTDAFQGAVKHEVNYASELFNTELGIRRWVSNDASVLLGLRFMSINEDLDFFSFHDSPGISDGVYSIHTDNNLLGTQIGGELSRPLFGDWLRIVMEGKAGVFLNFAEQDSHFIDSKAPLFARDHKSDTGFASLLELAVSLSARLSDHISLRGGYRFVGITGLALAPDQLLDNSDRINPGQFISTDGSLHLHGPFVEGEFLLP